MKVAAVFAFISALFLAGCVSTDQQLSQDVLQFRDAVFASRLCDEKEEVVFGIEPIGKRVLCIRGELDLEFFSQLNSVDMSDVSVVVADSRGGISIDTIDLVFDLGVNEYDIVIREECLSVCANYLFVGARRKFLLSGSRLGWNGGENGSREDFLKTLRGYYGYGDDWPQEKEDIDRFEKSWAALLLAYQQQSKLFFDQNVSEHLMFDHYDVVRCELDRLVVLQLLMKERRMERSLFSPSLDLLRNKYGVRDVFAEAPEEFGASIMHVADDRGRFEAYAMRAECL